jgi:hypothetical protein
MKEIKISENKYNSEELKGIIRDVNYQMQELRESIRRTPSSIKMLSVPEPYIHPWWKH